MKKHIVFFVLVFAALINAQEFGIGVLMDSSLYANSPTAAPLMRGDYDNLPKSSSLKNFVPTPGNQGMTSTCAGWSTGYAGRTIIEAMRYGYSKDEVNNNTFSPSFVYNQIRVNNSCSGGTSLIDALDVLKNFGGMKFKEFGFECEREVTSNDKLKATDYRIIEYRDISHNDETAETKYVKKSLAEHKPVIIAFDCAPSFSKAKELWKPDSSEYKYWGRGHGMAVIGYDDEKFGGAFEIINSWGTKWGKDGFVWIKYSDFDYFTQYAFELVDKFVKDSNKVDLSGSLIFKESNGEDMRTKFVANHFITKKSYPAGTLFELRLSNNEPAYVYAFSSDLTNKTYKIFPFNNRMVAYLPYSQNNVAIPDEDSYNILDETAGTSYYCFLYSSKKLDIDAIMSSVEKEKGTFVDKVLKVLKNDLVDLSNINYSATDRIDFKAKSKGKSVVPVIVEIEHTK